MKRIEVDLKRPFPVAKLKWRRGQGGSGELVYITARDVMDRLDEVFGPAGTLTEGGSAGVVESGLFVGLAQICFVGEEDGSCTVLEL